MNTHLSSLEPLIHCGIYKQNFKDFWTVSYIIPYSLILLLAKCCVHVEACLNALYSGQFYTANIWTPPQNREHAT